MLTFLLVKVLFFSIFTLPNHDLDDSASSSVDRGVFAERLHYHAEVILSFLAGQVRVFAKARVIQQALCGSRQRLQVCRCSYPCLILSLCSLFFSVPFFLSHCLIYLPETLFLGCNEARPLVYSGATTRQMN